MLCSQGGKQHGYIHRHFQIRIYHDLVLINQNISQHHENSGTLLTNECFLKLAREVLQLEVILAYSTNTSIVQGLVTLVAIYAISLTLLQR